MADCIGLILRYDLISLRVWRNQSTLTSKMWKKVYNFPLLQSIINESSLCCVLTFSTLPSLHHLHQERSHRWINDVRIGCKSTCLFKSLSLSVHWTKRWLRLMWLGGMATSSTRSSALCDSTRHSASSCHSQLWFDFLNVIEEFRFIKRRVKWHNLEAKKRKGVSRCINLDKSSFDTS